MEMKLPEPGYLGNDCTEYDDDDDDIATMTSSLSVSKLLFSKQEQEDTDVINNTPSSGYKLSSLVDTALSLGFPVDDAATTTTTAVAANDDQHDYDDEYDIFLSFSIDEKNDHV